MNKEEVRKEILQLINQSDQVIGFHSILCRFSEKRKKELEAEQKIGLVITKTIYTFPRPLTDSEIYLITKIVWDLIFERLLTPLFDTYENKVSGRFLITK